MEKLKNKNQGMIMLEAVMVLAMSCVLFFMLFMITFIYYQEWTIKTIADSTAAQIAQSYKLPDSEMNGKADKNMIVNIDPYRYFLLRKNILKTKNETKAKLYVIDSYKKASILKNLDNPTVTMELKSDSLSRRHITVHIKGTYKVPFQMLFLPNDITYDIEGSAECLDLIDYLNTVDYVDNVTSLSLLNSKIIQAINSVLKLFNHISG